MAGETKLGFEIRILLSVFHSPELPNALLGKKIYANGNRKVTVRWKVKITVGEEKGVN